MDGSLASGNPPGIARTKTKDTDNKHDTIISAMLLREKRYNKKCFSSRKLMRRLVDIARKIDRK